MSTKQRASPTKRRRVASRHQAAGKSPTETSSDDSTVARNREIPRLLIDELQRQNPVDVVEALERLYDLLNIDGNDDDDDDSNGRGNCVEMQKFGAISLLVICMRRWPKDEEIQGWICCILGEILCFDDCAKDIMMRSGGIEAVVAAMKRFPSPGDKQLLQMNGLRVIRNTFVTKDKVPSNDLQACQKQFIEDLDGVSLVVGAMKRFNPFPGHVDLLVNGCDALRMLAWKANHDVLVKEGAVVVVSEIQLKHFDNEDVRKVTNDFFTELYSEDSSSSN